MMLNLMVAPYILLGRVRLKFFFFLGGWGWGLAPRNCREAEVAVILSLILVILLLFLEALGIIRVYFRTFCRWRNPFDDSFFFTRPFGGMFKSNLLFGSSGSPFMNMHPSKFLEHQGSSGSGQPNKFRGLK